jgi:hypothetical protein
MNKINDIKSFRALNQEQKKKIYEDEIGRIETYIYDSGWYRSLSKEVRQEIKKHKPWHLYQTVKDKTPVRLYGLARDIEHKWTYLVATMEDDNKNSLSMGQIQDINLIEAVTWDTLSETYILNLIKARNYGGDVLFLKPEMFLVFGGE